MKIEGGCHCGRVRFVVEADTPLDVYDCNCSICRKSGFLHLIVPLRQFQLLQGADVLTCYTLNTHVAQHTFCRYCGIKSFYTPRSNPDGVDVNVRCLDDVYSMKVTPFDGENWEQNAAALSHKSR